jgi:hypothetical protein
VSGPRAETLRLEHARRLLLATATAASEGAGELDDVLVELFADLDRLRSDDVVSAAVRLVVEVIDELTTVTAQSRDDIVQRLALSAPRVDGEPK